MSDTHTTACICIEDAAELTGYSARYLRKLVRLGLLTCSEEDKDLIVWSEVQRLATHQKPFWVALPDNALGSKEPDPRLLFHSNNSEEKLLSEESFHNKIEVGNCVDMMRRMPAGIVQTVVTSPPYWGVRAYPGEINVQWADGNNCGLGEEPTVEGYVAHTLEVLRNIKRVLKDDGTVWWNLGDTYQTRAYLRSSSTERLNAIEGAREDLWRDYPNKRYSSGHSYLKDKDLTMVPLLVALGAEHLGFYVRSIIIWHKHNAGIDTAKDRPSAIHEYILLLAKSRFYKYNAGKVTEEASTGKVIRRINGKEEYEIVRNRSLRTVWEFPTSSAGDHAAAFPLELPVRCIQLSTDEGDLVLDPFAGSGTTLLAANLLGRRFYGCELLEEYAKDATERLKAPNEVFKASRARRAKDKKQMGSAHDQLQTPLLDV